MFHNDNTLSVKAGDANQCRRAIWYQLKGFPRDFRKISFNATRQRVNEAIKVILREELASAGWVSHAPPYTAGNPMVSTLVSVDPGLDLYLISTEEYDVVSHTDHTGGKHVPLLMLILNHDRYALSQHLGPRLAHPAQTIRLAAHHRRYGVYYGDAAPWVATYDANEHVWENEPVSTDLILKQAAIQLTPLREHLTSNVQKPPDRDFEPDSHQCRECAFFSQCQGAPGPSTANEITPWTTDNPPDELLAALEDYQEAEAALQTTNTFNEQRKQAQAIIAVYMRAISKKTVELNTDLGSARITLVPGRSNSVNSKLCRELLGELWDQVATITEYDYARITLRKGKG